MDDLERFLRRGFTLITDDIDELVESGFARAYPQAVDGYEATVWEREANEGAQGTNRRFQRVMARQRAYLIPGRAKTS